MISTILEVICMALRNIITVGDPILRKVSRKI